MKFIIATAFVLILASLGSALVFMMRDRGSTKKMANSLTIRVGLSVSLFILILLAHSMGWIHSTGRLY